MLIESLYKAKQNDFSMNSSWANEQGLSGYLYRFGQYNEFKKKWKKQYLENQIIWMELESLGEELEKRNLQVGVLKGFALIPDIYTDLGSRFASDVDLWVPLGELVKIKSILKDKGFVESVNGSWKADDFKTIFIKERQGLSIVIELHTRLFWHVDSQKWRFQKFSIPGFICLKKEDQLLHLCGHYAFQHNFLKFFWLVDIYEYVKKYKTQIDWNLFWERARRERLLLSSFVCLKVLDLRGLLRLKEPLRLSHLPYALKWRGVGVSLLIFKHYVEDSRKNLALYYLVKILMKDSWSEAFDYNWSWLKCKLGFSSRF